MCLSGIKTSPDLTSLDNMLQISPLHDKNFSGCSNWGKKQRRGYHRILSGMKKAIYNGERLRILTLTNKTWNERLNKDFQALKQRIRRAGYRFEYWKCRTSEGGGVLHIVCRGSDDDFIPQSYLSEMWYQITGDSYVVDIREINIADVKNVARYVVSQHLTAGQGGFYVRGSWSWGWVCQGFVSVWKDIISTYANTRGMKFCIDMWDKWLMWCVVPDGHHLKKVSHIQKGQFKPRWFDGRMWWLGQGIND